MPRRRLLVLLVPALAALALTACQGPAPLVAPEVVWESTGDSPLESDPAVIAAREADIAERIAWNAADFSYAPFVDTHTAEWAAQIADAFERRFVDAGVSPYVYLGPALWQPVEVRATDRGADVVVCDASAHWYLQRDHTTRSTEDLEDGLGAVIELEAAADGRLLVAGQSFEGAVDGCDATGAPIGRFEPAPELPERVDAVVRPPG